MELYQIFIVHVCVDIHFWFFEFDQQGSFVVRKNIVITLFAEDCVLNFFGVGDFVYFHGMDDNF